MNGATSLLGFILNLLKNPQAQAEFRASPEQVLAAHGLTGVCAADIHETLPLVTDHRSVELTSTSHSAQPSVVPARGTATPTLPSSTCATSRTRTRTKTTASTSTSRCT